MAIQIRLSEWENRGGITLRFHHQYDPDDRWRLISLDQTEAVQLHSLLTDYLAEADEEPDQADARV